MSDPCFCYHVKKKREEQSPLNLKNKNVDIRISHIRGEEKKKSSTDSFI